MSSVEWDTYAKTYRQLARALRIPALLGNILQAQPSGTLLDVGCGEGHLLCRVTTNYPTWTVRGFETSAFRADVARARGLEVDVDSTGKIPPGKFDVVVSSHVIEHTIDDHDHAKQLAALLAPGGVLYVETPLKLRNGWYFRRSPAGWALDPTHVREYRSPEQLAAVLRSAGLSVTAIAITPMRFSLASASALMQRVTHLGTAMPNGRLARLTVRIPRYRNLSMLATRTPEAFRATSGPVSGPGHSPTA